MNALRPLYLPLGNASPLDGVDLLFAQRIAQSNNLSFGFSSSDSDELTQQILGFSDEGNDQRPLPRQNSTRDTSKLPEDEVVTSKAQVINFFLAALLHASRQGHLCLIVDERGVFPSFCALDSQIQKDLLEIPGIVVRVDNRYYLYRNWVCEQQFIAAHAKLLMQEVKSIALGEAPGLTGEQRRAVEKALCSSLTLISGGPGTGKSFTAAMLVRRAVEAGLSVAVAAPTGKATMHIGQAVEGAHVKTLHSLLVKKRELPYDLIVVDEASMIDAPLMTQLFTSLKEGARLVLLGDRDQLPPIDTGHFFADLAKSTDACFLQECHRTELQEIISWAKDVKNGKSIPYSPLTPDIVEKIATKLRHCGQNTFCVLSPLRQGRYGVDLLNEFLHERLADLPTPIMIRENKGEFVNGQRGVLTGEEAEIGGKVYRRYQLPRFEYAYVMSVHKSQGSEYSEVWVLLPEGAVHFGREMLYTAITRARKRVELFAVEGVVETIVSSHTSRLSGIMRCPQRHLSCSHEQDLRPQWL
ncbi:MAG: ATP-dependent RecD-like DNA helicase [Chlamydiales bacterium]